MKNNAKVNSEKPRQYLKEAIDLQKDYLKFLKANIVFLFFVFVFYGIGNIAEYYTFNNQQLLTLSGTKADVNGARQLPSLSLDTWVFFLIYWISFYITPALLLWFHRNSNVMSDGTRKAPRLKFNFIKSLGRTMINYRLYLLVLFVSFVALLTIFLFLKILPELVSGLTPIFQDYMEHQKNSILFEPANSIAVKNYMEDINAISTVRWSLSILELCIGALLIHIIYMVAMPLVAINKSVGFFKSIYYAIAATLENWNLYLSASIMMALFFVASKLFDDIFVLSRILSILLPVLILPYMILLNKKMFKKAE